MNTPFALVICSLVFSGAYLLKDHLDRQYHSNPFNYSVQKYEFIIHPSLNNAVWRLNKADGTVELCFYSAEKSKEGSGTTITGAPVCY